MRRVPSELDDLVVEVIKSNQKRLDQTFVNHNPIHWPILFCSRCRLTDIPHELLHSC
jgi:hypothetical protein